MEDNLPISIMASETLLAEYVKLKGIINKQEAHVNFQTLAAGWYEDENNVLTIKLYIEKHDEYLQLVSLNTLGNKIEVADDVMLYINNKDISCFVAITESEIKLLDKEPKILSGYITMKVKKVINEIAEKQGLLTLPL
ncbi:hypothetical protein [Pseudocolwellia agarivorans]|uniref:hypothetical protein n=1 Tax=Pseudocolwellia agarivorans TaxID=1911682 RepID=UPI0009849A38|nr:hypothetical protein [Pseudocolwellia agarivorans]